MPADAAVDLAAYRETVAWFIEELAGSSGGSAEKLTHDRIVRAFSQPGAEALLPLLLGGPDHTAGVLAEELDRHRDNAHRSPSAGSALALIRTYLLARIDGLWWDEAPAFETIGDAIRSPELIDVRDLRRSGGLNFCYHRLPRGLPGRGVDWAFRKVAPAARPRTAGLRLTRVRPEMLAMLSQLADDFKRVAPTGTPNIWVTSMVRSVEEQDELRTLGYPGFLPSAHCSGYAFDVEVEWFRRFGARDLILDLLLERERAGSINAIDEGQVWHVCMSPRVVAEIRTSMTVPGGR